MTADFSGVFLTVEEHGCVYTVDTEGELFFAPLYQDNSVSLEEFDFVDFEVSDTDDKELEEIQECLCKMTQTAGLYFKPAVPV
jgi:hypothetical protein